MGEYEAQSDLARKLAERFDDFRRGVPSCLGTCFHCDVDGTEYEITIEVKV